MVFSIGFTGYATPTRDIQTLDLTLSPAVTLQRGFQIVDGNIHNRYGDLIMTLDENGLNQYGKNVCADFLVVYSDDAAGPIGPAPRMNLFSGTLHVNQNTTGSNATQPIGPRFNFLGTNHSAVRFQYQAGVPPSLNVGVHNYTINTTAGWATIARGQQSIIPVLGGIHWASDNYQARISGQGGSGNVTITVTRQ